MDLLCFVVALCASNGFICYRYYTQRTAVVVHYMKVLQNVLDSTYQHFVFSSPGATVLYNTTYIAASKYNVMY